MIAMEIADHTTLNSLFHFGMFNVKNEQLLDEMIILCTNSSDRLLFVLNRICPS